LVSTPSFANPTLTAFQNSKVRRPRTKICWLLQVPCRSKDPRASVRWMMTSRLP
jgi:hypothetical protein